MTFRQALNRLVWCNVGPDLADGKWALPALRLRQHCLLVCGDSVFHARQTSVPTSLEDASRNGNCRRLSVAPLMQSAQRACGGTVVAMATTVNSASGASNFCGVRGDQYPSRLRYEEASTRSWNRLRYLRGRCNCGFWVFSVQPGSAMSSAKWARSGPQQQWQGFTPDSWSIIIQLFYSNLRLHSPDSIYQSRAYAGKCSLSRAG